MRLGIYDVKGFFYNFIYGKDWLHLFEMDSILKCFNNTDSLSNSIFYDGSHRLPDFNNVINQLSEDNMIKINQFSVNITLIGKMRIKTGGYLRTSMIKRLSFLGVILGIAASIVTILMFFS